MSRDECSSTDRIESVRRPAATPVFCTADCCVALRTVVLHFGLVLYCGLLCCTAVCRVSLRFVVFD